MAELTAEQKAFVRHLVAQELDSRENAGTDASGRRAHKTVTDAEYARLTNRHPNTMKNWRQLPAVQAAVKAGVEAALSSKDYFKTCLYQQALEEMWVQYDKAKGAEKRQWHDRVMKEVGDVKEAEADPVSYEDLSDEDLVNLILSRELSVIGMTSAQLRARLKGEPCDSTSTSPATGEAASAPASPRPSQASRSSRARSKSSKRSSSSSNE